MDSRLGGHARLKFAARFQASMRLFNIFIPATLIGLIFSELVLVSSSFVVAAYIVSDVDPSVWLMYSDGIARIAVMAVGVILGLYFQDLYADIRVTSKVALIQQYCLVIGVAFLIQAMLSYTAPSLVLPRWVMMIGSGLILITMPAWRIVYGSLVVQGLASQRVLFLGSSKVAREIAQRLANRPELGMASIGFVDDIEDESNLPEGQKLLGPLSRMREIVASSKPDVIVVGMSERRGRLPVQDLLELRFSGSRIEDAATNYERTFGRVSLSEIHPSQLIFSTELGPRPNRMALQTMYSLAIALVVAVVTAPLMLLIAVLIRLTSRGPALYRQRRVGLNGHLFMLYKFRSMRIDAEAETGAVWASLDDPRATGLGKWLRRLRLDELPQLLNVLRGEMSIVGPRPERPEFMATLAEKIPFYPQRLCVKPGITGWAQINYKYGDTLDDTVAKLEYDLYYIKNLSPALDAYVLFHTLKVMLLSRGAQ